VGVDVREFLGNSAIMMALSFVTALAVGGFPSGFFLSNGNIAMLTLVVMMSISLTSLQLRGLRVRDHAVPIQRAFFLSFVLSSGTTILMAFLFQGELREGWIIEAAVPSAVSVVPFTYLMRGDLEQTLVSSAALYIIALAVTPFLTLLFLGMPIDEGILVLYVGVLILLPLAASRLLRRFRISQANKSAAINVAFFILIVAIAGPNRQVFFGDWVVLLGLIGVAIARIFVVGLAWNWFLRRTGVPRSRRVPEVLFSTYKNTGMAATLAFALIGPAAAVPPAVCTVVEITWLIFMSHFLFRPERQVALGGS
jgi:BASS family bile acid:Na+ symporter